MKMKSLLAITVMFLAHQAVFALGKKPINTGLKCTIELPSDSADPNATAPTATVLINGASSDHLTKALVLIHPESGVTHIVSIPSGDPNSSKIGASTVIANQINDIKQTKLLVIDPALAATKDPNSGEMDPAENVNIVFKIKVSYSEKLESNGKRGYAGSLYYSLTDKGASLQDSGPTECACVKPFELAEAVKVGFNPTLVDCEAMTVKPGKTPKKPAAN